MSEESTMQETIQGLLGKAAELTDPIWERIKTRINAATLAEAERGIGIAKRHAERRGAYGDALYRKGYTDACEEIVEILADILAPAKDDEDENGEEDDATT